MAEYEISHPRIPQIGNTVLEGPDDLPPPTERDFWNVVQRQVRPFGLSQLTDEEKISAYKNGYFDEPEPVEGQPEQPGIVDSLLDLGGKALLRGGQMAKAITSMPVIRESGIAPLMSEISSILPSGPYDKILKLEDKAIPYEKTENADQFREAGKYLFGFLDNTQSAYTNSSYYNSEGELGFDPVAEALKRTGMPFYSKNKNARGRVKTAAMDYAQESMVAGMGEGYARAASGGEFLYKGGKLLKDKQMTPTAYDTSPFGDINTPITQGLPDDSDILDYVNSSIEFDALNHRYENSAELAAFVLENPQESAKAMGAGLVGGLTPFVEAEDLNEILIDEEDINLDSDLQQDIRSGFVQPDVGVSFLSEILGDPMNLAGGTTAKAVTAPQRVALSGKITQTLNEVTKLNQGKSMAIRALEKFPEDSLIAQRQAKYLEAANQSLAQKQKVLDKYARNSMFLRMAAQSSPDELLKVAAKNIDTTSDAGKASMNMVYNAMKPSGKIGLVRKGIAMGARLTPEIAGATIGASMYGPEGAAAGALAPSIIKGAKIISTMPENIAISYIMRSATEAGEEITEQAARKQWRRLTAKYLYPAGILGLSGGAVLGSQEGGGGISDSLLKIGGGAFALKFLPKLAQFSDAAMRDSRVIGPELIYARGENSPFFNRLALLPSADEGLIGANADRFQALTRTSSGETILEKTIDKIRPIGRGIATSVTDEFPTGAPFRPGLSDTNKMLSNPTRKAAQFLDRTPTLGRGLETLGRFGTVVTAGSTLPAAFGYVGSGGQAEGALAGAIVSAPFTSIGAGAGMFQSYKNKSDLFQQKMGDVYYYREHLNKSEQADFDALPMHIRMALSGYSLSHPDIMFQPGTEGRGNFSFNPDLQTSVVEYNKATGAGLIEGVLAHEVGHHIEIHGLTPMVNKLFFGDPVTKEGGVYGKFNDEGEIVPNKEFEDLRDFYLKRLSGDDSINPADADRYQGKEGQQLLVSELFAEQVRDYLLSGKKDKGNTVAQKIIRASSEAMMGTPFVRDFLLKMNLPMKADGKFIEGGFFEGKLRRIPEITKLIDQYYKDTRAMRQREIQGEEVTTPGTNRVDKELSIDSRKAKRPIDKEDFESSFSIKDQNDPAIKAKLDTGGVFKWRPTADGKGSELETGPTGTPKRYTAKELEKQNRAQGDHAIKVFEKNGVDIITHKDGKKSTGDITNLTPEMIDELAQGPWHPRQIQTLREISRSLREGDGERAGFLIGYFAASTGRKPKAVPFTLRQEMPYGFKLTKDGNILALLHDVPQLEKNLKFLKGGKRLPGKYRDEYNQLFGNDTEVWEAFRQYRVNTANGMDGQLGLDNDPALAIRKKNFLNALHGAIDTEHINLNPILSEISKLKGMDMFNPSKRQPFGPATKTFRLDRIFDVTRSGNRNSNVNVDRAKKLLMPAAFHGTPHTLAPEAGAPLGKFRTSKIGTGEGAQAYGHGLYFAGRKEVAEHYRKALTGNDPNRFTGDLEYKVKGIEVPKERIGHASIDLANHIESVLYSRKFSKLKGVEDYETSQIYKIYNRWAETADRKSPADRSTEALLDYWFDHAEKAKAVDIIENRGSLYKVELAPKDSEYLLWDKPLSEQPKGVREKIEKGSENFDDLVGYSSYKEMIDAGGLSRLFSNDGGSFYDTLSRELGGPSASAALKEAGIPGIKYLDGASRSKGEGDFNYVIFDEADVTVTDKLFMPASEAGAGKGKQAEAAKLWNEKGTDSPYFKKYSGGAKVVKIGEQHDFVSGEPVVVEGVHGSTHTFKEFDPSKGNPESDLGKAVYISNTPDEVGVNYAGEGPDLTGRIERKAETYMGMIEDELSSYGLSDDATQQQIETKSYELARNELVGEGPQTYRVFAKFKNPVVVGEKFRSIDDFRNKGGKKETNFEMMFDEDAGTESGTLVDLLEQVDEVAYDFEFVDVDKVKYDIMEAADYDSIGAQELIKTMKESEGLMDTMDADGELANGEFVRQVFEGMGFDGIIDLSVNEKFGSQRKMGQSMEGMNPDTIHYLAFKPEQIKSSTGNRGTFDAGERNINYMPSDAKAPKAQPANRIQQLAPAMPGNRFMAPAASAGAKLSERFR